MIKQVFTLILAACLSALPATSPSLADEHETDDRKTQRCINARTLKRTDVVDDGRIIFYMAGKKTYLNVLPRLCKGLSRDRRFSYVTSGRRLCGIDTIRILQDTAGSLREGKICRLGPFYPITREDAASIIERSQAPPQARPPSLPDPEEVTTDDAGADESVSWQPGKVGVTPASSA